MRQAVLDHRCLCSPQSRVPPGRWNSEPDGSGGKRAGSDESAPTGTSTPTAAARGTIGERIGALRHVHARLRRARCGAAGAVQSPVRSAHDQVRGRRRRHHWRARHPAPPTRSTAAGAPRRAPRPTRARSRPARTTPTPPFRTTVLRLEPGRAVVPRSSARTACSPTGHATACSDGICYDTKNFHDRCGDCNTACAANTEWCNAGHCCTTDKLYCGGACVSVLTDKANCGGCGVACSGGTPYCSKGACIAACVPSGTRQAF